MHTRICRILSCVHIFSRINPQILEAEEDSNNRQRWCYGIFQTESNHLGSITQYAYYARDKNLSVDGLSASWQSRQVVSAYRRGYRLQGNFASCLCKPIWWET